MLPERARLVHGIGIVKTHAGVPARGQQQTRVSAEAQTGDAICRRRRELEPQGGGWGRVRSHVLKILNLQSQQQYSMQVVVSSVLEITV